MSPDDRWRVQHMIDSCEQALAFAQGKTRSDLSSDTMLIFALVKAVEIVGEAASKVTEAGRLEMPDVPWHVVVGMRNRLVHAYFNIDANILWNTVETRLPELLVVLRSYVVSEPDG